VVVRGYERWAVTKTGKGKLNVIGGQILSKMYVSSCVSRAWRINYNEEFYNLYKELSAAEMIKID
jgi:hypothetical protein